jgi:hypothetical protein
MKHKALVNCKFARRASAGGDKRVLNCSHPLEGLTNLTESM